MPGMLDSVTSTAVLLLWDSVTGTAVIIAVGLSD